MTRPLLRRGLRATRGSQGHRGRARRQDHRPRAFGRPAAPRGCAPPSIRRLGARHARRRHRSGAPGHLGRVAGRHADRALGRAPHAYLGSYRVLTTPTPSFGLDGNGPRSLGDPRRWPTAWTCSTSRWRARGESADDLVARAIHGAARAGVVTVVAAGNSGDDLGGGSVSSPGSAPTRSRSRRERRALRGRLGRRGRARRRPGRPRNLRSRVERRGSDPVRVERRRPADGSRATCGGGRAGALVLVQLGPQCTAPAPRPRSPPARSESSSPGTRPAIRSRSTTARCGR